MRWTVFAIFAFAMVAIQLSVGNLLTMESLGFIRPDLVACLAVFISLFASRSSALWACWILGMAMDLAPQGGGQITPVIGPHALGYVFGGYLVLQLRTMVFRRKAITMGFMTLLFVLGASIVGIAILTIRGWYPDQLPPASGALSAVGKSFVLALYSGLIAMPLGWALGLTITVWGFQGGGQRRGGTASWSTSAARG